MVVCGEADMDTIVVLLLVVLVSTVLLCFDSRRRVGRVLYWRIIPSVVSVFFVVSFQARQKYRLTDTQYGAIEVLAMYTGLLAFYWFFILRPRKLFDTLLRQAGSLFEKGDTQRALKTYDQALDKAKSNLDKATILYNIAYANLRLGQREAALEALSATLTFAPLLKSRIEKDKRFMELHNDEKFRILTARR
jgi:tetratricopeptide (TPR) repeat protein